MIQEFEARKSVRSYNGKPVDDETIMQLMQAARLAPSGNNTQPWQFIIVKSQEIREKIAAVNHHQQWMLEAPVHIVCVADIRARMQGEEPINLEEDSPMEELKQIIRDTAIAAEHIVLQAQSVGLASCWTAWFTQDAIRPVLSIPCDKYVVCVITVGYSETPVKAAPKKALNDLLHYESW